MDSKSAAMGSVALVSVLFGMQVVPWIVSRKSIANPRSISGHVHRADLRDDANNRVLVSSECNHCRGFALGLFAKGLEIIASVFFTFSLAILSRSFAA